MGLPLAYVLAFKVALMLLAAQGEIFMCAGIGAGVAFPAVSEIVVSVLGQQTVGTAGVAADEHPLLTKADLGADVYPTSLVPPKWLDGSLRWHDLFAYAPKFFEHIDELEFRGQLLLFELLAN